MTGQELHTQDGYDWPAGCSDERWPADKHQPAAPYFQPRCALKECHCAKYSQSGQPARGCEFFA